VSRVDESRDQAARNASPDLADDRESADGAAVTLPAVTVVIPTHNRAELMSATLRSVLAQKDVDLHVVVVDDASSDSTAAVLEAMSDPRVRWRRNEEPTGVACARNAGLAMVETPWVAFTDDDDLWAPEKLARQLASLRLNPQARWSVVGCVIVDDSLRIVRHEHPPETSTLADRLLSNNCVPGGGSGVLASTDLVRELGGFDPQLSNLADWDLWIRLALAAPAAGVAQPLVAYRLHESGMAHGVRQTEAELIKVTEKFADERARRGVSIDWATWHRYIARLHLRTGDQRAAAHSYLLAAQHGHPTRYGVVALCLLVPGLWTWADRRGRLRVPLHWSRSADAWLEEWRREQPPSVSL
jgi:glycosyltransferase involved in cell wall biosynthesis